ncbi:MAG: acyltransferase family protein [Thermodesulfobacteriota bacterium]
MIFINYQESKLPINTPNLANFLLLSLLFLLCLLFLRRRKEDPQHFLDRKQTEQLKGAAILFIVAGHLWAHVATTRPSLMFSDDAVAVFLLLSGYGLTISIRTKILRGKDFFWRRLNRVMVPYWLASVFILLLDYIFLGRTYQLYDLMMTSLGINLNSTTRHIDYVRWFVTYIIVWYVIFFAVIPKLLPPNNLFMLFCVAAVMFFADYYVFDFGKHFVMFPLGCCLGTYRDYLSHFIRKHQKYVALTAFLCGFFVISSEFLLAAASLRQYIYTMMPNILMAAYTEFTSIIFSMGLICGVRWLTLQKYESVFLLLCGRYSYEIFLIHGALLIKYNPVIRDERLLSLIVGFILFVMLLLLLASGLEKISNFCLTRGPLTKKTV